LHFYTSSAFAYLNYLDCRRDSRSLTLAAWRFGVGTISDASDPEYVNGLEVSSDLFPTLGLPMYRGRGFNEDEDRPGAPLVFEGKPYTIVGVAAPAIQPPGAPDIYTLLGQETDPRMQNREIHPVIQVWGGCVPESRRSRRAWSSG